MFSLHRTRYPAISVCLVAGFAACTVPNPNRRPDACVAEPDEQFCARIGATCQAAAGADNCGTARTALCGACSGTDACVANVCKAPVCSAFSFPRLMLPTALNDAAKQDTLSGASSDGKTVLWQRGICGTPLQLLIGDSDGGGFVIADLSAQLALAPMAADQDGTLTLTADGLTIIGMSDDGTYVLEASRPGLGTTGFAPASNANFTALNVPRPTRIGFPVISSDGLAFYFRKSNSANPNDNGIYEAVRASATAPFPAATKMPGLIQGYDSITGISSDRLTVFVQDTGTQTYALTRRSQTDPFVNPNTAGLPPKIPGFRTRPLNDCQTVIATYSAGDCDKEDIAFYTK